jgi:hypothetical protein
MPALGLFICGVLQADAGPTAIVRHCLVRVAGRHRRAGCRNDATANASLGQKYTARIRPNMDASNILNWRPLSFPSFRYQGRKPTEIVMNAQCLHYNRNGDNADDLYQRSRRKQFYK